MLFAELFEAPLADFGAYGDLETPGSFRSEDLKAIRSPKWREKVYRAFERTPFVFNVYVYNGGDGHVTFQHGTLRISNTVDVKDTNRLPHFAGVHDRSTVENLIGKTLPNADTSITVVLVENEGEERVSLTPWILAHRIVHALLYAGQQGYRSIFSIQRRFQNVVSVIGSLQFSHMFKSDMTDLEKINIVAKEFGTWKSARNGNLANPGEFIAEMITQYLVKGKVILNKPIDKTAAMSRRIEEKEEEINYYCEDFFKACVGKAFIL